MSHTPGPWSMGDHAIWSGDPLKGGTKVALVLLVEPFEEEQSNARLIAAAPELYEALKRFTDHMDFESQIEDYNDFDRETEALIDQARAALAKVEEVKE